MRVHVISDVHGAAESLAAAGEGADLFICLGDLILFLDYDDPAQGIYAEVLGAQVAHRNAQLRLAQRFDEARALTAAAWDEVSGGAGHGERIRAFIQAANRQYEKMFAQMPRPALLTYGNVDVPALWSQHLRPGHQVVDGGVVEAGGLRIGLVGGGLHSPYRTPNELDPAEYARKVAGLGPVDVLCTHIPPALPQLMYDVVSRRFEVASTAINEAIREYQPRVALFGHVHQPLVARARIGRTECINVGHFRSSRSPFVLDL